MEAKSYGNFTSNNPYQTNLKQLFTTLAANGPATGFNVTTVGQPPNQVYGLVFCRGDVSADDCRKCISDAGTQFTSLCPLQKEGTIWLDYCSLRYSNVSFFRVRDDEINYNWDSDNNTDPVKYTNMAVSLLNNLSSQATAGGFGLMFSTGVSSFNESFKIYGLVQCTRDLTIADCKTCLAKAAGFIPRCCSSQLGAIAFSKTCYTRYDSYQFFSSGTSAPSLNPTSPLASPPVNLVGPSRGSGNRNLLVIVLSVLVPWAVLISVVCCGVLARKLKAGKHKANAGIPNGEFLIFELDTIKAATNNFSQEKKLGEGGFGPVYKGKLEDEQEIAIKRLSMFSAQGRTEFKNEVQLVAKLQHKNLVRILGCCSEGDENILVYEYVPNSSLDKFIFDPDRRAELSWKQLLEIIKGVARGLQYLHEDSRLTVVHRDVKASNVLLDRNLNPKIADFGLARLLTMDQTHCDTSKIAGTYGYMAPEYAMHGNLSTKLDVYSFGVLLLEIVSGKKSTAFDELGDQDLLSYAWKLWKESKMLELMDQALSDSCPKVEALRCIHIGLLCVQENPSHRPTMSSLVMMLNSASVTLPMPLSPFFLDRSQGSFVLHSSSSASMQVTNPSE
ncbi:cysteine-rich receptor-like protein kinase 44 isoform X2 [Nymphaea colorata]|uniref:cysteine-rich receptor-like protein kinase 44 isoform X2 n=1 Tax=Nymphaea colorata TaxID=210225 RepID=UPI00129D982B|nr:cysteine-rich receptor-like protein kinase 44 isoform X2 [Nymphaea colorata]